MVHAAVAPRLVGRAHLIRYADDAVIIFIFFIFGQERDARRVLDVLPKRRPQDGLTLHPEKTRLVDSRLRTEELCRRLITAMRAGGPAFSTCWASPTTGPGP